MAKLVQQLRALSVTVETQSSVIEQLKQENTELKAKLGQSRLVWALLEAAGGCLKATELLRSLDIALRQR